jgi:hypothetical protein
MTRSLLLSENCRLVDVGRSLSDERTGLSFADSELSHFTRVALYSLRADRTENPDPLLVSTNHTENISCGSNWFIRNITPRTSHVTPTE